MTTTPVLTEGLGQPATAEAEPAATAQPDHTACQRAIKSLDGAIGARDTEIFDLKRRLETLHDTLAKARSGAELVVPQPFAPPWPQSAQQVIDQQQRALNTLAARLGAAEQRIYELTNPGRYVGVSR